MPSGGVASASTGPYGKSNLFPRAIESNSSAATIGLVRSELQHQLLVRRTFGKVPLDCFQHGLLQGVTNQVVLHVH